MKRSIKYKSKRKRNENRSKVRRLPLAIVIKKYKRTLEAESMIKKKVKLITRSSIDLETHLVDIIDILWGILRVLEKAFPTEETNIEK